MFDGNWRDAVADERADPALAFIAGALVCFIFTMSGLDTVGNFLRGVAPESLVETLTSFSFLSRFLP